MKLILSMLLLIPSLTIAAEWKISHEIQTEKYRKVCIYINKAGELKSVEQAKSQYCRTYHNSALSSVSSPVSGV